MSENVKNGYREFDHSGTLKMCNGAHSVLSVAC